MTLSSAGSVAGSNFAIQVRDVDTEGFEGLLGEILLAEADERNVKAGRVEPWNHPAKRRLTPCIREPSHPRWSQTCRIFSRRPGAGEVTG